MVRMMRTWTFVVTLALVYWAPQQAFADSAAEIEAGVADTLALFKKEVKGGSEYLSKSAGVLVFPSVIKGGIGIGGEYGEGALRVGGKTVAYYSTASASIGLQFGIQEKSLVVVFKTNGALKSFRNSDGWKAGVDGSVAIAKWGAGEDVNTLEDQSPVVGFIIGNKGLMYNLTFEGSKFSRIDR
ncbi:MAG: YSC84-related protein [Pseudomonadota bacterium]